MVCEVSTLWFETGFEAVENTARGWIRVGDGDASGVVEEADPGDGGVRGAVVAIDFGEVEQIVRTAKDPRVPGVAAPMPKLSTGWPGDIEDGCIDVPAAGGI